MTDNATERRRTMTAKGKPASRGTRTNSEFWAVVIGGSLVGILAVLAVWLGAPVARSDADVVVYKTAHCGCCTDWIQQLEDSDLDVHVVNVRDTHTIQAQLGVPSTASSCHTAMVGNYWVEGHVPIDLVHHLISDALSGIKGLAVPGMVIGSPGMEGPNPSDYNVIAFDNEGESYVYDSREGKKYPQ